MNFAIFDEDFKVDKAEYLKEIQNLEKNAIEKEFEEDWKIFLKEQLKDTRSFYLLKTALKAIIQLKKSADFDTAIFASLSFMPDQTFVETAIMIIARFSQFDKNLAAHFNLDITEILNAKLLAKNKKANKQQTKDHKSKKNQQNKKKAVVSEDIIPEKQLISAKSRQLAPVEKHLKKMTLKTSRK